MSVLSAVLGALGKQRAMTTMRWIALTWLLAFGIGIGVAWYVSGLAVPDRDVDARVSAEYANSISASRAVEKTPGDDPASSRNEPFRLVADGVGPGGVHSLKLAGRSYDLHLTHDGSGPLRVEARSIANGQRWMLVERAGSWQGIVAFDPPSEGSYDFLVDTEGTWSLEITETGASTQ